MPQVDSFLLPELPEPVEKPMQPSDAKARPPSVEADVLIPKPL